ncbi:MAG: M48 family metallopeptidase, partial [Pseudomonadota bacterium]
MTMIRVGAAPETYSGKGLYFSGESAEATRAELAVDEAAGTLAMRLLDGTRIDWALASLRRVRDQAGGDLMVLRQADDPVARLVLSATEDQRILLARAPNLHRAPKVDGKRKLFAWAGAAVASVALMIFVLIPLLANNLAAVLPPAGERALGQTTFEQIRTALDDSGLQPVPVCENPDGLAALDKIGETLFPDEVEGFDLTVSVLDHEMVNAFALPGGYVVFFRGLLEAAESPDEVAAVYAHEVGHVVARDPARIALRSAGSIGVLGLLLGDFAGGAVVLFLAERIIQADYSQEAEAAADAFAFDVM